MIFFQSNASRKFCLWKQVDMPRHSRRALCSIAMQSSKRIFYLRECRRARLPKEVGLSIYTTLIRTILIEIWCTPVWGLRNSFILRRRGGTYAGKVLNTYRSPKDSLSSLESRRNEWKLLHKNFVTLAMVTAIPYTTELLLLEIVTTT